MPRNSPFNIVLTENEREYLEGISNIVAQNFPKEDKKLENIDSSLEIATKDKIYNFEIELKEKGISYYIKNSQGLLYIIDESSKKNLIKESKFFFK